VGRILKEKPAKEPESSSKDNDNRIVSKYAGHTWHADLTAVPISGGFWTNWVPNSLWQRWPICWWLLNVEDHFSRRWMGFAVFKTRPESEDVTAALDRIIEVEQAKPKPNQNTSSSTRAASSSASTSRRNGAKSETSHLDSER
jgi:hypothetical protein